MIKWMQVECVRSPDRRRFLLLSASEKERLERDFIEAEASVRLEGLAPSEIFFAVKARVLAGEISFEQGREDILASHRTKSSAIA